MAPWFTSDHHSGHGGARGLFKRPFGTVAEMDAAMVARWNEVVRSDDEVWHLGDFAVRQSAARMGQLLAALAGEKHLITGNNDGPATAGLAGWASVQSYAEIRMASTWLILCHYPLRTWNRMSRGALNLHGHSHGRLAPLPRPVDVGVDLWNFRPITLARSAPISAAGADPGVCDHGTKPRSWDWHRQLPPNHLSF